MAKKKKAEKEVEKKYSKMDKLRGIPEADANWAEAKERAENAPKSAGEGGLLSAAKAKDKENKAKVNTFNS